ncbi:MAG: murein biosynthesis integral membrane protein MurJ [bacterium]
MNPGPLPPKPGLPPSEIRNESESAVARFAGPISLATFLSRILGFARDVFIARFFGAALIADAFFVAFAIPSMFRRLLTEGALTSAFIPVYSDVRAGRGEEAARRFSGAMAVSLAVFLALFCLLGIGLARPLVAALAPGFVSDPAKFGLTIRLTQVVFPFLFFIGLSAVAAGVLNASRRFFIPALAPAVQNVAMIAALWLAGAAVRAEEAVLWLAWGVVIGGALQLLMLLPPMSRMGIFPAPAIPWKVPGVGRCLSLMGPAAFGVAILQINILIDRWLASFLAEGSISYLYYANRLVQFPHGILSIAVAAAAFPVLADRAAKKRHGEATEEAGGRTLAEAWRLTLFITLPATFGLIALARPIMEVLFERGAFGAADTAASAAALRAYAAGLVFFGLSRLLAAAYHSRLDTRFPVRCANWAVLANVVGSVALMFPLKFVGLALATSMASALNAYLLYRGLKVSGEWPGEPIAAALKYPLPISALMGAGLYWINWLLWPAGAGIWLRAGVLFFEIAAGAGLYLAVCARFMPEPSMLKRTLLGRN